MKQLCQTETVWQRLVWRDFKKREKRSTIESWRQFYRVLKEEQKQPQAALGRLLGSFRPEMSKILLLKMRNG
jgi:hypothetical protein